MEYEIVFESNNILYITGVSGSGKSSLAKDLQKNYNCKLICLDNLSLYYKGGIGVEKSEALASSLYQKAIENGFKIQSNYVIIDSIEDMGNQKLRKIKEVIKL